MCKGTVSYMLCDQGSSERPLELIRRLWYPIVSPLEEEEWRPLCFMFEGHTLASGGGWRRGEGPRGTKTASVRPSDDDDEEERKEGEPQELYLRGLTARRTAHGRGRTAAAAAADQLGRSKNQTNRRTDQMTARARQPGRD